MRLFQSKTKREIEELKAQVEALKRELKRRTEVRIGELTPYYLFCWNDVDPRPSIKIIDLLPMLMDNNGLELKETPEVRSKIVLEKKQKVSK